MPDIIKINTADNIVEIESTGVITKEDIEASIAKLLQIYSDTGINKILVDTTGQDAMPESRHILNIFLNIPEELRAALLVKQEQPTLKDIRFAEAASYKNTPNVLLFFDREKAIKWLNAGSGV